MRRNDKIVALFALLAGCTAEPNSGSAPSANCTADSECPSDLVCRYDLCVTVQSEPRELAFRLVPPNSSTWRPQTVKPALVSLDEAVNIALAPSVRVAGKLLYISESNQLRPDGPSGVLTFTREGMSQSSEQYRVESDSRYAIYLLPGRYQVTFVPDDAGAPPVNFGVKEFSLDTDPELTVPVRNLTVTGAIRDAAGPGLRAQALPDASVVAISRQTGAMSSVGTTDASGFFSFSLLPASDRYDLRVRHETSDYMREVTAFDALDCTASKCTNLLSEDATFQVSLDGVVGMSRPHAITVRANSEQAIDFAGVVVEIKGTFDWGTARVRRALSSTGTFEVQVPDGDYEIVVTTAAEFPLAGKTLEVRLDETEVKASVALEPKVKAQLDVVDLEGSPAAGARVELRAEKSADPMVVTADDDGRVEVFLEAVPHRVVVSASQVGVARGVYEWLPSKPERRLDLPAAAVLTGNVLGTARTMERQGESAWEAVENVSVQVLEKFGESMVTVGESTTRGDGGFKVLIPAEKP